MFYNSLCLLYTSNLDTVLIMCLVRTAACPDGMLVNVAFYLVGMPMLALCYMLASSLGRMWLSSGVMFEIKKRSRKRFKYEVRRLKRQQDHIKCELIGKALSESRTRDFWKEVRRLSNSKHGRCASAPVIDNISNDHDISELFSSKMEALLTPPAISVSVLTYLEKLVLP